VVDIADHLQLICHRRSREAGPPRRHPSRVPPWDFIRQLPLPNVWLGVSCEDQKNADVRIPLLLETPAAVRFISAEPLLGPIALEFPHLHESPKNPRTHYEPVALQQLADNLKAVGQITPSWCARGRSGRAATSSPPGTGVSARPSWPACHPSPASSGRWTEAQFVEILNIENLQRDDLNALEEAQGFVP
jgi:hypothetical protein